MQFFASSIFRGRNTIQENVDKNEPIGTETDNDGCWIYETNVFKLGKATKNCGNEYKVADCTR